MSTTTTNDVAKGTPKDRNYIGGGGWDNSGKFGTFINLQLSLEDLKNCTVDSYGKVHITVSARKEADAKSKMDVKVYESEAK